MLREKDAMRMAALQKSVLQGIDDSLRRFHDLPPEVFFKGTLLRLGLSLGLPAVIGGSYQNKSYSIFSLWLHANQRNAGL